ncbi:putative dual-specificity RNA methyltransferase RlmN [Propionispora sp. 2/2-37]|uniref:23S rRNA (adenine(2503)-C(2))-methyltransferase RlmN n=1 Tax=Propionispora sp. 2/2-37 TaxID=1677858 RepID=UPI0006C16373|nr:23S rRNA (adenine(2503)-C(2))-methyltransferase RlmN [Propionispora sp. 2/2-37]CUH94216.1 putative dual-specificity RNA methyltransferase RlmN [Propionispora sp. 2/2-37]
MKIALPGMYVDEIAAAIKPFKLPAYRARQIADWMYRYHVDDFSDMTNLSKETRRLLSEHFLIRNYKIKDSLHSADGKTSKFLLAFSDQTTVETVLMRQPYGNSVCVSTQVGCAMGCAFCASTLYGLTRNLTAGEIISQILYIDSYLAVKREKIDTIVIMGMGEPLANYDNVLKFIRLCHEEYVLNISYRSITLSTSGLIPEIDRLSEEKLPITLSISLHGANDNVRSKIMPVNRRYNIASLLAAGDRYAACTGRRVTYEYTLIAGYNDHIEDAKELAGLLRHRLASVNLIPVNSVPERGLLRPVVAKVKQFERVLLDNKINVTVRKEMGTDIQAACGQLRQKNIDTDKS